MLQSIIGRISKQRPMTDTEIKIIEYAQKMFFEVGFTNTTLRKLSQDTGIGVGTITYYYRTKEELLLVFVEELFERHMDIIEEIKDSTKDSMLSCAVEIAVQIAVCETDQKARDFYYAAYSHPLTFDKIKEWTAQKNYTILKDVCPELTETDFKKLENVTSGIELAAFSIPVTRFFTLKDKIELVVDSIFKIYDIPASQRKATINKLIELDIEKIAAEMHQKIM